jgi:hypothetical protein
VLRKAPMLLLLFGILLYWFCMSKPFKLHFHISLEILFYCSGLKIIGHGNPDNNLESPCVFEEKWQRLTSNPGLLVRALP